MISFKIVPSSDFSYALLLHTRMGLVHWLHHLLPHSRAVVVRQEFSSNSPQILSVSMLSILNSNNLCQMGDLGSWKLQKQLY